MYCDQALRGRTGLTDRLQTKWQSNRLVVAHDPEVATRRGQARDKTIAELVAMGQQCGDKLDGQDAGKRAKGWPMSDSGTKARFYHAVKDAHMAHVIKVRGALTV